jgi:hypothetical protein
MSTLSIIWNNKVDLLMLGVLTGCLIFGMARESWEILGGGTLLGLGYGIGNFKNKVLLIKNGLRDEYSAGDLLLWAKDIFGGKSANASRTIIVDSKEEKDEFIAQGFRAENIYVRDEYVDNDK